MYAVEAVSEAPSEVPTSCEASCEAAGRQGSVLVAFLDIGCQLLDHEAVEVHNAGVVTQLGQHRCLAVHLQDGKASKRASVSMAACKHKQ